MIPKYETTFNAVITNAEELYFYARNFQNELATAVEGKESKAAKTKRPRLRPARSTRPLTRALPHRTCF